MVYVQAFFIFLAMTSATWLIGLATFNALMREPDLFKHRSCRSTSCLMIFMVTLYCFVPFPWGYFAALLFYGLAAKDLLRAALLQGAGPLPHPGSALYGVSTRRPGRTAL